MMPQLVIFASGSGSNAENIVRYFLNKPQIRVSGLCTNRPDAYVIERMKKYDIPVLVFNRNDLHEITKVDDWMVQKGADWIILAGFLWLMPARLIQAYPNRIINIHPALLPNYGGKGMYGHHVHEAVIANGEKQSGITIHYVNNEYDRGETIFQATCPVEPDDTADTLAERVHDLEYRHFPAIIEQEVMKGIHNE
ncbi:MAG: phosphoribosylglycinamide formyltransferase [Bacteroidales bacterium]|nr:phosphoribosylglycinamide formyltransferase [Bacteroidales bacterium]